MRTGLGPEYPQAAGSCSCRRRHCRHLPCRIAQMLSGPRRMTAVELGDRGQVVEQQQQQLLVSRWSKAGLPGGGGGGGTVGVTH